MAGGGQSATNNIFVHFSSNVLGSYISSFMVHLLVFSLDGIWAYHHVLKKKNFIISHTLNYISCF